MDRPASARAAAAEWGAAMPLLHKSITEFREQEREFYRTEGERRGFQDASDRFGQAYASAQKQMAAVNVDFEKSIVKLNDLATEKKSEDLTEFFNQAKKALNTHQKLLDFDPEATKPTDAPRP